MAWPCWGKKWICVGMMQQYFPSCFCTPVPIWRKCIHRSQNDVTVLLRTQPASKLFWHVLFCLPCWCSNNKQAPCEGMLYYDKESLLLLIYIFNPKRGRSEHLLSLSGKIYQHPVPHSCKFYMYPITYKNDQMYFFPKGIFKTFFLSYRGWCGDFGCSIVCLFVLINK